MTPAAAICEIMNDDGTMARLSQLELFAAHHKLKIISIRDLTTWAVEEMTGGHELADIQGSSAALTAAVEAKRRP